jgi:hypothetical protein
MLGLLRPLKMVRDCACARSSHLPHFVADLKPGGRAGPPDETTVFLNMLPVVIPCIFLIAICIVVIALRYFNAIAEQTPEGARVLPAQ